MTQKIFHSSSSEVEHGAGQPAPLARARHRQHREGQHPGGQRHRPPHRQASHRRGVAAVEVSRGGGRYSTKDSYTIGRHNIDTQFLETPFSFKVDRTTT